MNKKLKEHYMQLSSWSYSQIISTCEWIVTLHTTRSTLHSWLSSLQFDLLLILLAYFIYLFPSSISRPTSASTHCGRQKWNEDGFTPKLLSIDSPYGCCINLHLNLHYITIINIFISIFSCMIDCTDCILARYTT